MAIGKAGKRRAEAMEGRVPRTGADACGAAAGLHTAVGARRERATSASNAGPLVRDG